MRTRAEKYILLDGAPRQLHALYHNPEKKKMIQSRPDNPNLLRTDYGKGDIYNTTVINKLVCLFVNKMASLDPFGCGIEMEANKPNWFDALNGLPALFGSSTCETFELKRLCLFIKNALQMGGPDKIALTQEIHSFLIHLAGLIREWLNSNEKDRDFQYWDKSYALKEDYRNKVSFGIGGKETDIETSELVSILDDAVVKIDAGLMKARNEDIYIGYFINEVAEYDQKEGHIVPRKFTQKPLVPFLEPQVHALRLASSSKDALALYRGTRKSELFDRKLKMYKVTGCLSCLPEEIGRCRAFTPGWLENESIWLHMEYKYILEILKNGLYEEFYEDFKNTLIPFQKPAVYGRSILENSSFLVSSAFPYPQLHGNGFVARLSGSTVEFLQMWLIINAGQRPFFINEKGELNLRFAPALAAWLFDAKTKAYCFTFLGSIAVTYHNSKLKDTFGKKGVKVRQVSFTDAAGRQVTIESDTIPHPYAQDIRARQIKAINIELK